MCPAFSPRRVDELLGRRNKEETTSILEESGIFRRGHHCNQPTSRQNVVWLLWEKASRKFDIPMDT